MTTGAEGCDQGDRAQESWRGCGTRSGSLAGQGDVINNLPVDDLARVEKHPGVRVEKVEGLRMYFLAMHVAHKPFDNKLVRQAISYAVDPAAVKFIYEGNGYVMNGPVGSNVIGYDPKVKRYPFDPKRAKELLASAGYPNGLEVKLYFSPDRYPGRGRSARSSPINFSRPA